MQDNYSIHSRPITHKVEKDVVMTLTRAQADIQRFKERLGSNVLITLTITAHLPTRPVLNEDNATE